MRDQKRAFFLAAGVFAFTLLFLGQGYGLADDCVVLGGGINVAGECEISTAVSRSGTFTLDETLHITGTGNITVPSSTSANSLIINIAGQLVMDDGAKINGDTSPTSGGQSAAQQGATITITASGNITLAGDSGLGGAKITAEMQAGSCSGGGSGGNISLMTTNGNIRAYGGSVISSSSTHCSAGDIVVTADAPGKIDLDGLVLARSLRSGDGSGKAGGGRITIISGCDLTVSNTSIVSSQGKDMGADLVHLEGCKVVIRGLVESVAVQGGGHTDDVDNVCNTDLSSHPYPGNANYFTACVEIWSGTTIEIDNTGSNNGEVSVDGVVANSSWIDLFANGDVTIKGDTTGNYAVHGNPTGATNNSAALITIKSKNAKVSTSDRAIQANATGGGAAGGVIIVQGSGNAEFGSASVQAIGSNSGEGGIITARSFNGSVTGVALGELNASGGTGGTPGIVTLQGCGTPAPGDGVAYSGTVTPSPALNPGDACGGTPDVPSLPTTCDCTVVQKGTIIIKKVTDPSSNTTTSFAFTAGGGLSPGSFSLKNNETQTFSDLTPGSGYRVDETTIPAGWTLTSATCDDGSQVSNIDVSAGETVTCTFTNKQQSPPHDPPIAIPTTTAWGTILLVVFLGSVALYYLRRLSLAR